MQMKKIFTKVFYPESPSFPQQDMIKIANFIISQQDMVKLLIPHPLVQQLCPFQLDQKRFHLG